MGIEDPCNRDFRSTGDEKLEQCRLLPSSCQDCVQEGDLFFMVQALVQAIYDNDCRVYHTLLRESLKRPKVGLDTVSYTATAVKVRL